MPEEIHERLGGVSNILLCTPGFGGDGRSACTDLLVGESPGETDVLWVSYTRPPSECVAGVRERSVSPARQAVLVLGEGRGNEPPSGVTVEQAGAPNDLTGLGITLQRYLEEWEPPMTVCFDSLTSLLQYVDIETAYEFLHVLTGQLHAAGATAHFHLDPDAHEDRAVTMLTTLFDARVTVTDEGFDVRRRRLPNESRR